MQTSMLLGMFDWIGDFFKALFDLIPKVIYLLYASLACVMDVLQLFFRKLAGLDVYYVDGKAVGGDLVTNFIAGILGIAGDFDSGLEGQDYSSLSTVFWAFIIFGVIICFVSTLVAVIKSHYNYDDKAAKGPMQYVYTAGKAIINMAAVPLIVVLGLFVSQAVLTALDSITSVSSSSLEQIYGKANITEYLQDVDTVKTATGKEDSDKKTYIYYDIFGFGGAIYYGKSAPDPSTQPAESPKTLALIGAANQTFSGSMFKVAAFNGNRARLGQMSLDEHFTGGKNYSLSKMKLFQAAETQEELADMIDTAFANNLHTKNWFRLDYTFDNIASMKYFTNYLTQIANNFSKFNVGLVWYYYDLWNFNFIVGFGAIIVCLTIFINIILGLITRLFMCIALFLIAPPLFGLAPLDGGGAAKKWRENFVKQVLMTYGAVLGMNIMFLILPYINKIDFFNIKIADYFAQTLIIIVGLITIKALISTISSIIGAEDAVAAGDKINKDVKGTIGKAAGLTAGVGLAVAKGYGAAYKMGKAGVNKVAELKNRARRGSEDKKYAELDAAKKRVDSGEGRNQLDNIHKKLKNGSLNDQQAAEQLKGLGYSDMQVTQMIRGSRQSFADEEKEVVKQRRKAEQEARDQGLSAKEIQAAGIAAERKVRDSAKSGSEIFSSALGQSRDRHNTAQKIIKNREDARKNLHAARELSSASVSGVLGGFKVGIGADDEDSFMGGMSKAFRKTGGFKTAKEIKDKQEEKEQKDAIKDTAKYTKKIVEQNQKIAEQNEELTEKVKKLDNRLDKWF